MKSSPHSEFLCDFSEGLADAAEVRVGFRMGAGQPRTAKIAAYKAIYLGIVVAVFSTSILFIVAEYLPVWLTPDPTLQRIIFELLPLMGFGQILMVVGTVCWGIIGAQGRVRLATTIEFIASWIIVIPISTLFVYAFNFNLLGLVAALVLGYTVGGLANAYLILRSDWGALSDIVASRNCTDAMKFEDYDWVDLPSHIQDAAVVLGYDKKIWDADKEAASSKKDWEELSHAEQEAARSLGYNRSKWNGTSDTGDDDSVLQSSNNHEDLSWDMLPATIQKAAKILGYDNKLWDADKDPESAKKDWDELSPAERIAASTLGYNKVCWESGGDAGIDPPNASNRSPSCIRDDCYDEYDWEELHTVIQNAAAVLGYNEKIWNTDGAPASDDKYWRELSEAERKAAKKLGYNEEKWDDGSQEEGHTVNNPSKADEVVAGSGDISSSREPPSSGSFVWKELPGELLGSISKMLSFEESISSNEKKEQDSSPFENEMERRKAEEPCGVVNHEVILDDNDDGDPSSINIDECDWDELPSEIQKAAKVLGYNKKMWDADQAPPSDDKYWHELSKLEQKSARKLGYDKEKWNDGSSGSEEESCTVPSNTSYRDSDWDELASEIQKAARVLGYSKNMWDADQVPPSANKYWDELTSAEQKAAKKLGFNKRS
jgi:hypothetical protein